MWYLLFQENGIKSKLEDNAFINSGKCKMCLKGKMK